MTASALASFLGDDETDPRGVCGGGGARGRASLDDNCSFDSAVFDEPLVDADVAAAALRGAASSADRPRRDRDESALGEEEDDDDECDDDDDDRLETQPSAVAQTETRRR